MRILIVEDEFKIADVIASRLRKENYIVDVFGNGEEGLDNALTNIYDLIILDVMLPKVDGFKILEEIRREKINAKVIMLTAKSMIEDKLTGFNNGANDYLTKPFHIDELVARVNAQLRMDNVQVQKDYVEAGDLRLNIKNTTLTCTTNNESIEVVCKEFMLLEYLMKNQNQVLQKEQLYEKIWGLDNESESNNLEAYLSFIRKKIKIIGSNVQIKAIRGLGYKLEVD
ncbi:dNA-binding response regulator DltR [Clostridium sp. CAG:245]|jgi:two component transcriptional regulator, winged helix family|nr:dNA-binding response regulator DltR [Clostridium sp. CAG:245]